MNTARLIKAFEKVGLKVDLVKGHTYQETTTKHYCVKSSSHFCSFYDQNGHAVVVNVRRHNDEHDLQSDYCAGWFCKTIKHAVNSTLGGW